MSSGFNKIVGVDYEEIRVRYQNDLRSSLEADPDVLLTGASSKEVRDRYLGVLRTALRSDLDLLVICNHMHDEEDISMANRAWLSGHSVMLISNRHLAPAGTTWLQMQIS